jgi:hypothetical protein
MPPRKSIEGVCANANCPRPGAPLAVTGKERKHALKRGRAYCSPECGKAGRRANVSSAMTAMWANPEARARMLAARRGTRQANP